MEPNLICNLTRFKTLALFGDFPLQIKSSFFPKKKEKLFELKLKL